MELNNKKILIVSPFFFDYHSRMKRELEKRGATVDVVNEQPSGSAIARILMRKDVPIYHATVNRYFDKVLSGLRSEYDYILFIKCEAPTIEVLKKFRNKYPSAKQILYLWDSVANITHIAKKFNYFDKFYSFDKGDVKRYTFLEYAYWGYTDEFDTESDSVPTYDVAFIGTFHSVRPTVISNIEAQCKQLGLRFYKFVYLPHKVVFWYNKLTNPCFKGIKSSQVHYSPLSTEETINIYKKSFSVLEVENSRQSGATTRLGEMIGMRKKIITTFDCKDAEYFRKEDQLIIDVNNIKLEKEFFETPYVQLPEDVRRRYSFDAFIEKVFS